MTEALPHVDALVIATPPSTHLLLGLQALSAGKFLIEKSVATSIDEARNLIAAAEEAQRVLGRVSGLMR